MTPVSIAAGCLAALICGLITGRCLRGFREGNALAHAIAAAVGLTVLQISKLTDLGRIVQPKVASDWLPLICLLSAFCCLIRPGKFRAAVGIALGVFATVRLVWGSVYLPADSWDLSVLLSLSVWAAALVVPVVFNEGRSASRVSWNTAAWAISVAATSMFITMSGSLTYGAAVGVCGLAILGVLLSSSRIPGTAAVPILCLIGLSTAFAELPFPTAGLMLLIWIGVVSADQLSSNRASAIVRMASAGILVLTASLTLGRFAETAGSSDASNSGYDSILLEVPAVSGNSKQKTTPSVVPDAPSNTPDATVDSTGEHSDSADPFGGLPVE